MKEVYKTCRDCQFVCSCCSSHFEGWIKCSGCEQHFDEFQPASHIKYCPMTGKSVDKN